jgi:hypothetical protein
MADGVPDQGQKPRLAADPPSHHEGMLARFGDASASPPLVSTPASLRYAPCGNEPLAARCLASEDVLYLAGGA